MFCVVTLCLRMQHVRNLPPYSNAIRPRGMKAIATTAGFIPVVIPNCEPGLDMRDFAGSPGDDRAIPRVTGEIFSARASDKERPSNENGLVEAVCLKEGVEWGREESKLHGVCPTGT